MMTVAVVPRTPSLEDLYTSEELEAILESLEGWVEIGRKVDKPLPEFHIDNLTRTDVGVVDYFVRFNRLPAAERQKLSGIAQGRELIRLPDRRGKPHTIKLESRVVQNISFDPTAEFPASGLKRIGQIRTVHFGTPFDNLWTCTWFTVMLQIPPELLRQTEAFFVKPAGGDGPTNDTRYGKVTLFG